MTAGKTPSIAGYCRISVDEALDQENTSIENQKAMIQEYVSSRFPGSPLTFFTDRDRSGYTFEQREGYQKLREALRNGVCSILVVKDFSRFSRRNSLGLYELELLRDEGVRIISIGDGVDYPTRDDWLNIQFRFLMNEMPVTDTSKKVRAVIQSRQAKGEWICSAPYGYYLDPVRKGEFCIDEEGAEVVRLIYRLYAKGWGYRKIAGHLTQRGFPTGLQLQIKQRKAQGKDTSRLEAKASPVWNSNSVAKIIGNDFYIGTLRQGQWRRQGIHKTDRRVPQEEQRAFPHHHPAILSQELFDEAAAQLRHRTNTSYRGVRKYPHTYTGYLYCADCGSPMFGISYPNRPPGYLCGAYHRRGLKGCTSHHVRERDIDENVRRYLQVVKDGMLHSLEQLDQMERAQHQEGLRHRLADLAQRKEQLQLELQGSIKERVRQILRFPQREEEINATFDALEEDYHQTLDALKRQEEVLTGELTRRTDLKKSIDRVLDRFALLLEKPRFERADLTAILRRILIDQDKVMTIELQGDVTELLDLLDETAMYRDGSGPPADGKSPGYETPGPAE